MHKNNRKAREDIYSCLEYILQSFDTANEKPWSFSPLGSTLTTDVKLVPTHRAAITK